MFLSYHAPEFTFKVFSLRQTSNRNPTIKLQNRLVIRPERVGTRREQNANPTDCARRER